MAALQPDRCGELLLAEALGFSQQAEVRRKYRFCQYSIVLYALWLGSQVNYSAAI